MFSMWGVLSKARRTVVWGMFKIIDGGKGAIRVPVKLGAQFGE